MCEVLVCSNSWVTVNGTTGSQAIDTKMPQQGDVIVAQADGWAWGVCELGGVVQGNPNLNHPFWRVFKLPGITLSQISTLLGAEVDVDPTKPSPYLQYRAFFIDITKIPAGALLTYYKDNTRGAPFIMLPKTFTYTQLQAYITQRQAVQF